MTEQSAEQAVYAGLTESGDEASPSEARNVLRHVTSLGMTKVADGLIDPKLVLSWLSGALGAPAAVTGLLVPIREAGALLPQMLLAPVVMSMKRRKWVWAAGALGQGIAAGAMVLAGLTLSGTVAGVALCCALAVLAVARSAASVSFKDILGRTVAKTRRGAVTGTASSVASAAVVIFALLLMSGFLQDKGPLLAAIGLAAVLWIGAVLVFSTLEEPEAEVQARSGIDLAPWREDPQFRLFVTVRGLLTVTALAPPYFVLLGGGAEALQGLGALVLASSAASFVSAYVWGRLSDRSSRTVLSLSGVFGAVFAGLAVVAEALGWTEAGWVAPAILFGFMMSYHGVRQGRSTYLVDMAPTETRASYTALANTLIGVLLLVTGAFGGVLALAGPMAALAGFAVLSAAGAVLALRLREVEVSEAR